MVKIMNNKYSMEQQLEWVNKPKDKPLVTGDKLIMSISVIGGFIMLLQEMVKVAFS